MTSAFIWGQVIGVLSTVLGVLLGAGVYHVSRFGFPKLTINRPAPAPPGVVLSAPSQSFTGPLQPPEEVDEARYAAQAGSYLKHLMSEVDTHGSAFGEGWN
jgi:hypothetical protein